MKLQKLMKEVPQDLLAVEPFASWQELSPSFDKRPLGDCTIVLATVKEEDFEPLVGVFQSREEAMGAFLSFAVEHGWEEVPQTYCVYHAQEVEGRLVAGLLHQGQVSTYEQTTLEQMVQVMARVHRVVVYSYEVVTYVKDLYPEVDHKVYAVARKLAKVLKRAPELEELAKIYGVLLESLEDRLKLIEKLLENPVRTPFGEVELPPYSYPLKSCD
ncbi:MAG: hypothetical protein RMI44_00295 [Aquificaceae bacterium]|nr:hypothetical protein [Aquificaceae bacterium]